MSYLICQILICLLIAFLLGFLLGWFLRKLRCDRQCDELSSKLSIADDERNRLQGRVRELEDERSRLQLGNVSQRASSRPAGSTGAAMGLSSAASAQPQQFFAATGGGQPGVTNFEIEEIEGIGKGFGQRLRNIGIATTGALLDKCPAKSQAADVARRINLDPDSVQRWVCAADLMRIEGLDKDYAELLVWSDVPNVQQLANENAEQLTARAAAVNAREKRAREVPTASTIANWIEAASQLQPKLS